MGTRRIMTTAVLLLAFVLVKRAAAEGFAWFPWRRDASQTPAPTRQDDVSADPPARTAASPPAQTNRASQIATTRPTDGDSAAGGKLLSYAPGDSGSPSTVNANSAPGAPPPARRSFVDKLLRRRAPRRTAWEFWDQERPEHR